MVLVSQMCLLVRECLISLHDLLDGLNSGSETSSSAMKDLQSKLDAVNAECLAEKEKVFTLLES